MRHCGYLVRNPCEIQTKTGIGNTPPTQDEPLPTPRIWGGAVDFGNVIKRVQLAKGRRPSGKVHYLASCPPKKAGTTLCSHDSTLGYSLPQIVTKSQFHLNSMNSANSRRLISLLTGVVHRDVDADRFKSSILRLAQNRNALPPEELVREFGNSLTLRQLNGMTNPLTKRHPSERDQEALQEIHLEIFRSYLVKTLSA
jgi:hypothetical protein